MVPLFSLTQSGYHKLISPFFLVEDQRGRG